MLNQDSILNIKITMDKANYVNQCELVFVGVDNYNYIKQFLGNGDDVLTVNVGSDTYRFLIEDIDIKDAAIDTFTLWGRSKGAILGDPRYTLPTSYSYTDVVSAHTLLQQLCFGFSIELNFLDFFIQSDSLSKTNALPLDIIKDIVNAGALVLFSKPDGTLVFERYYKFPPSQLDLQTYTSSFDYKDDILAMGVEYNPLSDMNAVLVVSGSNSSQTGIILKLDDVLNHGKTVFAPDDIVFVRCYFIGDIRDYDVLLSSGNFVFAGEQTEQILREEIEITNGEVELEYPVETLDSIEFDEQIFDMPVYYQGQRGLFFNFDNTKVTIAYVTYTTKYKLYSVTRDKLGKLLFYIFETGG